MPPDLTLAGAADAGGFDQLTGERHERGTQRQKYQRCTLNAEQQRNAFGGIERLGLPSGGAMPMLFSKGLAGPNSCSQLSAVTWGGIIMGSMKQNTSQALPRMSVRVITKANRLPSTRAISMPRPEVYRLCHKARQVLAALSTFHSGALLPGPGR